MLTHKDLDALVAAALTWAVVAAVKAFLGPGSALDGIADSKCIDHVLAQVFVLR